VCAKHGHGNRNFDHKRDEIYKKFCKKKVHKTFSRGETTKLRFSNHSCTITGQVLSATRRPRRVLITNSSHESVLPTI
jgi:hypothetical protein